VAGWKATSITDAVDNGETEGDVIMRLMVDTSRVTFMVSKAAEPRMELGNQRQKTNKGTGQPEWSVGLFAMDESDGEVIRVTVAGDQPRVSQGQPVIVKDLEAIPWSNNGKFGVAYRASSITPASQPKAA
jgi:hypothetical protein